MVDFTKYSKLKTILIKMEKQRDDSHLGDFDLKNYPEYDDIVEFKSTFNTATEHRCVCVTIGRLKFRERERDKAHG